MPTFELKPFATSYVTANPNTNLYLLVDHAGIPGLDRKLRGSSVEWANLFDESREIGAFAAAPVLILVGSSSVLSLNSFFMRWISAKGAFTSNLILLASPQSIDIVKKRLIARLDVKLSEGMDAILRFYDPRIIEQLSKILSSQQCGKFFSPGHQWWYVNRKGELADVASEFRVVDEVDSQLFLSQYQEEALLDALEPDRILYLLLETAPQLEPKLPPDRYEFVAAKLAAARDFGIASTVDFTLYCMAALLCGINFESHPYWNKALAEVHMKRITFSQAVANSPEIEL